MRRMILAALVVFVLPVSLAAQTVSYVVSIPKPTSSLLRVVMEIRDASGPSLDVAMPAWSPGAYSLHWAAKNVQGLEARDGGGRALFHRGDLTFHPAGAEAVRIAFRAEGGRAVALEVRDGAFVLIATREG